MPVLPATRREPTEVSRAWPGIVPHRRAGCHDRRASIDARDAAIGALWDSRDFGLWIRVSAMARVRPKGRRARAERIRTPRADERTIPRAAPPASTPLSHRIMTPTSKTSYRLSIALGFLALAPLAQAHAMTVVSQPAALLVQEAKPERYVRTTVATKIANVPDKSGVTVAEIPEGTLLAVYDTKGEWLSVEAPQGLKAWVYGQYLRPTAQTGIAEVTGDGVRIRPKPSSSNDSYPLEQSLHEGDRVRVLSRNAPSKALSEDWVQIVTPPGVRGFIQASQTGRLESGTDGSTAWTEAVKKSTAGVALLDLQTGQASATGATTNAAAPAAGAAAVKPDAAPVQGTWEKAEAAYEAAKTATKPDWNSVRAGFQNYLDKNPSGANAEMATRRLQQITYHQEIERLKSDVALQEVKRQQLLAEAQAQLDEAALAQDPLWGRFQARGWLRRNETDAKRYYVEWAGRNASEITCGSGRYDLNLFVGAEIGVIGAMTRNTSSAVERPMRVDVSRIEVLSAPSGF